MTPDRTQLFQKFFQLSNIGFEEEETGALRDFCIGLAAWTLKEAKHPGSGELGFLALMKPNPALFMGLMMHLAANDPQIYYLLKRIVADALGATGEMPSLPVLYRQLARHMLLAEPPKPRSPKATQHCLLVLCVALACVMGRRPDQRNSHRDDDRSGIEYVRTALRSKYGVNLGKEQIRDPWRHREEKLELAGFPPTDVSGFLSRTSPTI